MEIYLVFVDTVHNSNKFWTAKVEGSNLTVQWGRVGYKSQTKVHTLTSHQRAVAKFNNLVAEKKAKGYRESQPEIDGSRSVSDIRRAIHLSIFIWLRQIFLRALCLTTTLFAHKIKGNRPSNQEVSDRLLSNSMEINIMTYVTHTPQAIIGSSVDEQALAQAELDNHLETQAQTVAPTQDPLTSHDRRIIGEIIEVEPASVRTIWIEGGITVWVQFVDGGRLPFDRNWFATRVAQVKASLPETPRERNERLSDELSEACAVFGLYHGEINWLSFSTKLYQDGHNVCFVGCNQEGWYARKRQYGLNRVAGNAKDVIASLGVRAPVAA